MPLAPCESPSPPALDVSRLHWRDAPGGLVRLVYEAGGGRLPVLTPDGHPVEFDTRTAWRFRNELLRAEKDADLRRQRELTREDGR